MYLNTKLIEMFKWLTDFSIELGNFAPVNMPVGNDTRSVENPSVEHFTKGKAYLGGPLCLETSYS